MNSGTYRAYVGDDYIRHLHEGQLECTNLMGEALGQLVTNSSAGLKLEYCEYLKISVCNASETNLVRLPKLTHVCVFL